MEYYIKRTTKFFGSDPFTVVVNDYTTKEIAERALELISSLKPLSKNIEWQKFFIDERY